MGLLQKCLLIFLFRNDPKICTYQYRPLYALFPINSVLQGKNGFKMFPLCFEPQPLLQKGSKASVCIDAKAQGSFLL